MASARRTPASSEYRSARARSARIRSSAALRGTAAAETVGQQLADGGAAVQPADLLGHELEAAVDLDGALSSAAARRRAGAAGCLADAVDADQGGVLAVADAERDAAEEQAAAGVDVSRSETTIAM